VVKHQNSRNHEFYLLGSREENQFFENYEKIQNTDMNPLKGRRKSCFLKHFFSKTFMDGNFVIPGYLFFQKVQNFILKNV
jgi:hypothetical protein